MQTILQSIIKAAKAKQSSNKGPKANFCHAPISATYRHNIQISTKIDHRWCWSEQEKNWLYGIFWACRPSKWNLVKSATFTLSIEWQICSWTMANYYYELDFAINLVLWKFFKKAYFKFWLFWPLENFLRQISYQTFISMLRRSLYNVS